MAKKKGSVMNIPGQLMYIGKEVAKERHDFVVKFLYQYFKEENTEEWIEYTNKFLKKKVK